MTAWVSAMFDGNRIEILSDGASYWDDDRVAAFISKVDPIDGFNAAQMTRGDSEMGDLVSGVVSDVFSASDTFDQAIETFREAMRGQPSWERPLQLAIWGISESLGPIAYWLSTGNRDDATKAWELHSTTKGTLQGEAVDWPHAWVASGTLADKAVWIMQNLRKTPHRDRVTGGLSRHPTIGGHIDLTTITEAYGVVQRRLHTWPDEIGKHMVLDPSSIDEASRVAYESGRAIVVAAQGGDPSARLDPLGIVPSLNRQQRRALERHERKRRSA